MTRYRGRPFSAKAIERDFPHVVEMRVPLGGFGKTLDAMHEWHTRRGIHALHLTGRRDENNHNCIRWCFGDAETAAAFASQFKQ
jgi:hypothetical protein